MNNKVFIATKQEQEDLILRVVDQLLVQRIPEIIRRVNTKTYLTTKDVKELLGMSSRLQAYHREAGNLPYSQEGKKIIYKSVDIEKFIDDRRIETQRRK